jgi:hypothetical protein
MSLFAFSKLHGLHFTTLLRLPSSERNYLFSLINNASFLWALEFDTSALWLLSSCTHEQSFSDYAYLEVLIEVWSNGYSRLSTIMVNMFVPSCRTSKRNMIASTFVEAVRLSLKFLLDIWGTCILKRLISQVSEVDNSVNNMRSSRPDINNKVRRHCTL